MRNATGLEPVFYVTTDFMAAYADALPEEAAIWIRSVLFHPDRALRRKWVFWQYAGRGRVAGVSGPVDLDVFNGSRQAWRAFVAGAAARPAPAGP